METGTCTTPGTTERPGRKFLVDPADGVGRLASLALDGSGYAHISYLDGFMALKYAYQDITGWHIQVVDDHDDHFAFNSIALGPSGDARIAYYHYDDPTPTWDGDLLYARLDVTGWITQTVDSADNVGFTLSMAVDESGYAHISYLDSTHFDLKYAYQDLSGWHVETADSTDYVGQSSSIAIDGDGYPHISYYQWNPLRNLKYAYKDISGWHTQTIAPSGKLLFNGNLSIALDAGDYPHISHNSNSRLNTPIRIFWAGIPAMPMPGRGSEVQLFRVELYGCLSYQLL